MPCGQHWDCKRCIQQEDDLVDRFNDLKGRAQAMEKAISTVRVNLGHERSCSHMRCVKSCAHAILDAALKGGA